MSGWIELINSIADRWSSGMWLVLWQSTVLAVIVFLLNLVLRKAPAGLRFWLWMLVPLRLVVMPLVTVSLPLLPAQIPKSESPFSLVLTDSLTERESPGAVPSILPAVETSIASPIADGVPPAALMNMDNLSSVIQPSLHTWLFVAWLAGAGFFAFRQIRGWYRIRCLTSQSHLVSNPEILALAAEASQRIGLRFVPRLVACDDDNPPLTTGVIRPVVALPATLIEQVSPDELLTVLSHEFAHIRRRDSLIGWFLGLCEVLYYFHPVFHLAKRLTMREREQACDETVLASQLAKPGMYAQALITAAASCRNPCSYVLPVAAVAESFSDLKRRVTLICSIVTPKARLSKVSLISLALLMIAGLPGIVLTARSATKTTGDVAASDPQTALPPADVIGPVEFARSMEAKEPVGVSQVVARSYQPTAPTQVVADIEETPVMRPVKSPSERSSSDETIKRQQAAKTIADIRPPFTFRIHTVTPEGKSQAGVEIRCLHPRPERGEAVVDTSVVSDETGTAGFHIIESDLVTDRYIWFSLANDKFMGTSGVGISPLDNQYEYTFRVWPTEKIEFHILSENAKPIPHAKVWLDAGFPAYPTIAQADSDGIAVVRFASVKATIAASAPGYAPTIISGADLSKKKSLTMQMEAGCAISGKLTDDQGNPLSNVSISAKKLNDPFGYLDDFISKTSTGPDGAFKIDHIAAGLYEVRTHLEGTDRPLFAYPVNVHVRKNNSDTRVKIQAQPGMVLKGRYIAKHKIGLKRAANRHSITIGTFSPKEASWEIRTDENLNFVIHIPTGTHGMIASTGLSGFYNFIKLPHKTHYFDIAKAGNAIRFRNVIPGFYDGIEVHYILAGMISGVVFDASGNPVSDLEVIARPYDRIYKTNSKGVYRGQVPPNMELTLEVRNRSTHQAIFRSEAFTVKEGEIVEKNLTINGFSRESVVNPKTADEHLATSNNEVSADSTENDLMLRQKSVNRLKVIRDALFRYSADHGEWPSSLQVLVKAGTLSPEQLTSPVAPTATQPAYRYIPPTSHDAPNIIVYENPAHYGNEGTLIVWGDGHIDWSAIQD